MIRGTKMNFRKWKVEKLAKKVKEKMKEAVGPPQKSEPVRSVPGAFPR